MNDHESTDRVPAEDVEHDEEALRDAEEKMHAQGTGGAEKARDEIEGPEDDVTHDEEAKRDAEEKMKTA